MQVRLLMLAASVLVFCSLASAATPVSMPEPSSLASAGVVAIGLAGAIWRKLRQ